MYHRKPVSLLDLDGTAMCPMLPPVSSLEGSSNKCGALQDGYSACTIQKAVSPLLSKYCSKSSVLCSSDSWNSVWISWFHSCTLEVTRWISQNRPETSKGSPGVYMVLHQWQAVFLPSFFLLAVYVLAIILKSPLSWQIPFIVWQGREVLVFSKESWGMWIGWNYRAVLFAKEQYSL